MRVFYIVVFATAALFASANARPGSQTNRHERRARSTNAHHYQKPLFNPDFDAVQNQLWENERSDQVPPVPKFPRSDWQNYQLPESGRSSFQNQGQFIDVDDDGQNNGIDKFPDPVRHVNNDDDEHNQDIENFVDSLRLLDNNGEDDQKNTEKFIQPVHHFNEDQGSQNDIEPPVHKKYYTNLGQRNNDHEVNTNNINQNFEVSGHRDQDQNQDRSREHDWDHYDDDDDDDDSAWDDDSGPDDSADEDSDEDDSFSKESGPDDDFENDSNSSDDLYNDDSSQDVDDSKDEDDQVQDQKPPKGFNEQGSINPRTVNGSPYFGRYKLDNQLGGNDDPQVQRWERNGAPRKDSYLKNECIVLCNTIKHTGDNFPEIISLCQCYTGGMIPNKK